MHMHMHMHMCRPLTASPRQAHVLEWVSGTPLVRPETFYFYHAFFGHMADADHPGQPAAFRELKSDCWQWLQRPQPPPASGAQAARLRGWQLLGLFGITTKQTVPGRLKQECHAAIGFTPSPRLAARMLTRDGAGGRLTPQMVEKQWRIWLHECAGKSRSQPGASRY